MNTDSGLNKQLTRRESLIQLLVVVILLVGISFFVTNYTVNAAKVAVDGKIGAPGTTGAMGSRGATGAQGLAGATGSTGAMGIGLIGVTGASGANGANGINGANGLAGANGTQGQTGLTGSLSDNFASYYNTTGLVAIPSGAHWIIEFPTQSISHGTGIAVIGSNIDIAASGTYLISTSGVIQKQTYEDYGQNLSFSVNLRESVNGGASNDVQPSPLGEYTIPIADNNSSTEVEQTFNVSQLVTVTAPTTFVVVVNNFSSGGYPNIYLYNHTVNIVQVD